MKNRATTVGTDENLRWRAKQKKSLDFWFWRSTMTPKDPMKVETIMKVVRTDQDYVPPTSPVDGEVVMLCPHTKNPRDNCHASFVHANGESQIAYTRVDGIRGTIAWIFECDDCFAKEKSLGAQREGRIYTWNGGPLVKAATS